MELLMPRIKANAHVNRTAMVQALTDEGYTIRIVKEESMWFHQPSSYFIEYWEEEEEEKEKK